jgi:hypothetical protein
LGILTSLSFNQKHTFKDKAQKKEFLMDIIKYKSYIAVCKNIAFINKAISYKRKNFVCIKKIEIEVLIDLQEKCTK